MTDTDSDTSAPATEEQPKRNSKRLIKWLVLLAVIAALLIGAPYGIQYGLKKGLIAAGAKHVEIEDVDFNPFIGELVIKNLQSKTGEQPELVVPRLLVDVDWLPLFSKQIMVRKLHLEGAELKIEQNEQAGTRVAGILLPQQQDKTTESAPSPWGFGIGELILTGNSVVISTPDFTTHSELSDVSLKQLISWTPEQTADFAFNSTLNQAPFSGDIQLQLFEATPRIEGRVKVEKLNVSEFRSLAGDAIKTLNANASVDIAFSLDFAPSGLVYEQDGMVTLSAVQLQTADISLEEPELLYQGLLSFSLVDGEQSLSSKGQLSTQNLALALPSPNVSIVFQNTRWNGAFDAVLHKEAPSLNATGRLTTDDIDVRENGASFESVHLGNLAIGDFRLNELVDIRANDIQIDRLRVATPSTKQASLLAVERIHIKQPAFLEQNQIRLDTVDLQGTRANVRIAKEGGLPLLDQLLASFKSTSNDEKNQPSAESEPMEILVGGVDLGNDSQVKLVLETAAKPVRKTIDIQTATIGSLNSNKPNADTPVQIKAVIDKHARFNTKGALKPFTKQLNLNLNTDIKALDLHGLSPLIQPLIGYNINSGQLNADSQLKINNDQLDGQNKLVINNLQVESAKSAATEELNQQLSMPLDAALDLLRDGNGDIQLNVPLTGDINAPNFELGDIISQAIGGAVKGTTTNLLKLALQPYGLIFMAAEKALEASASIQLEPVLFEAGKAELAGNSRDYLEKIANLMGQRPGIRIRVCGYATATDRIALQPPQKEDKKAEGAEQSATAPNPELEEALTQLAGQRAEVIKGHLVENASISAERLFTCLPKIDPKATAQPRVELLI